MAGETLITVIGNLTADPELRFTPSGAAVANFTVASTPRNFDRQTNEWKDGEALFLNCSVWRQAAENVAESLTRGMRVIVSGSAQGPLVRDPRGREAHGLRDRRRRGRPVAEVRHRQGRQDHRSGGGGGYSGGAAGGGGGGNDDPWASTGGGQSAPSGNQGGAWSGAQSAPQRDPWSAGSPAGGSSAGDEPPF